MNYDNQKIIPVEIDREMKKSFISYAMSVITARALPDVRDGLKPVHRRILYTMYEDGLFPEKAYRKSATTVGDVLGRYHPHGDSSVYDALVRMAQDFSLRYPMVDGHGNFGSVDGDAPAAYRYTEAKLSKLSMEMLTDIEKETVDFAPNFDDFRKEPVVLPSRFPSMLVNGSSGIAVGMATNMAPHNMGEAIDAAIYLLQNPECSLAELTAIVKGPDFPTGGLIMGGAGIREAYATGRGRLTVRARTHIEENGPKTRIIATEIPYQVNKARLIEAIAECVKDKRIDGISDLRDESDREGMRIVIDLKRDANAQVVQNQLFRYTQMQDTFAINNLALVDGEPRTLNLREMLWHYTEFQKEVIVRRTRYDLRKAEERAHILEGLRIAIDHIDEVIRTIRESYDNAKERLMERFGLSDVQAQAILEMRLRRLQGLEREKIEEEYRELTRKIADYKDILARPERVVAIVVEELSDIRRRFADPRRTEIVPFSDDIEDEDMIDVEDCVITLTHFGYVKRLHVNTYHAQRRGGRGVAALTTREEDFVEELFIASTHDYILFFTDRGRMFRLKGYMIPEAGRTAKGTNIINLMPIEPGEKVTAMIRVADFDEEGRYLTMVTRGGTVKRTALSEYRNVRKGGIIAIVLRDDDVLVRVKLTDGAQQIIIGTHDGKAIRFNESDARPMGRASHGVRGITLAPGDYVVGASILREGGKLLTVTENGYGKRAEPDDYRVQSRGGKGLINYSITEKTGKIAALKVVDDDDDIMLISSDGTVIRTAAEGIPIYSRATKGVRVMKVAGEDNRVVTVARTEKEEPEDELDEGADIDAREGAAQQAGYDAEDTDTDAGAGDE